MIDQKRLAVPAAGFYFVGSVFLLSVILFQVASGDHVTVAPIEVVTSETVPGSEPLPAEPPLPNEEEANQPTDGETSEVEAKPKTGIWNADFLALFEEPVIRYSGRGYKDKEFKYRLFVPEIKSPDEEFPLIVWLHGYGERGSDNVRHLKFINEYVTSPPYVRGRYPFFLLAVQCPRDNSYWTTNAADADDMLNVAMAALEKTLQENPAINKSRISLVGVSAGGSACWELAMRHPEVFSCVAPTGSSGGDNSRVASLVDIPVWAFHSTRDRLTLVDGVRATVSALAAAGGHVELTEINSTDHFCWRMAFDNYDLLGWLLQQQRGPEKSSPESIDNRKLWFGCVVVGFAVLLIVLIGVGRNRRLRARSEGFDTVDE